MQGLAQAAEDRPGPAERFMDLADPESPNPRLGQRLVPQSLRVLSQLAQAY
jgi:hypothetical protein